MIKIAIVGYGNIGKAAVQAIGAAKDMELLGVIRREVPKQLPSELAGIAVVTEVEALAQKPDVLLLCTPTRSVEEQAKKYLARGICTVDSFDIHGGIWALHEALDKVAKEHGSAAVISAGWDPGSDSVVRTLMEACAPKGITYTNFGPGMSMGHSVAARAKEGVRDALSVTIPIGTGLHRRMVYIEVEQGASFEDCKKAILADDYFCHDDSHVMQVECVDALRDKGHGVNLVRKGVSGNTDNQLFEFNMKINNPALTAQIMVACARAVTRQQSGCYTMIELPPVHLLEGDLCSNVGRLV